MTQDTDTRLYFGVDVNAQMQEWWAQEYLPDFKKKYGDYPIYVPVLDPEAALPHFWPSPFDYLLLTLVDGTNEKLYGPEGLRANVAGKLAPVLRCGLKRSGLIAEPEYIHLLAPGDFPHDGAGEHRGYKGGASGLPHGTDDFKVFTDVIDQLIVFRTAAAKAAYAASVARQPGWRYLNADGLPPATS